MMVPPVDADLAWLASAWLAVDPDPVTRAELEAVRDSEPERLRDLFGSGLAFGTAGLRGPMGPGPNRMNRVVVRRATAAVARRLEAQEEPTAARPGARVVVAYDARHNSAVFGEDACRVLAARGHPVAVFDRPVPTPVLAFAVRRMGARAGLMITASHNPAGESGYKIYWSDGAQIVHPLDSEIAAIIDALAPFGDEALASRGDPAISLVPQSIVEAYQDGVVSLLQQSGPRRVGMAYTPLHGVGRDVFVGALARAGFDAPVVVASQADPDPDFPTAPSPNPEDPRVLEPLLALAHAQGSDIALAHDPDADRLAVAVPDGSSWRVLSGDEVGAVLAEHLLSRPGKGPRLVVSTVVSSDLVARIAEHHGADHVACLTGFKWVMQVRREHPAHELVLGYEEALGYVIGDVVADKDGISAALVVAEMVAELRSSGRGLLDVLDDLERRHGVHRTAQRSLTWNRDAPDPLARLRAEPPKSIGGDPVREVIDLRDGGGGLPPADVVRLEMADGRLMARPSGTEPKVKIYGQAISAPVPDLAAARAAAETRLQRWLDGLVSLLTSP